jgi:hypothetical protein
MAEGIWEQAVETFLTIDRGLFLNPQYLVGEPGKWEANPDFLALCFPDNAAWMVEVTKAPRGSLFNKISLFERDYAPTIRGQLVQHQVIREENSELKWTVGLWIFAPAEWKPKLEDKLRAASVGKFRVTSLEDTTFPSWDARFR